MRREKIVEENVKMNTRAEGGGNSGEAKLWGEEAEGEREALREPKLAYTPHYLLPPFQFDTSVSLPRCQNSQAPEENKSDGRKVCLAFLTRVLFLIFAHKNKNLTSLFFFFKPFGVWNSKRKIATRAFFFFRT